MITTEAVLLNRQDLKAEFKKHDINSIKIEHFYSIDIHSLKFAIFIFIDTDGSTRVIKNRYGKESYLRTVPTEKQMLDIIFDNVFIRGIDLEAYSNSFADENSGLYTEMNKLYLGEK